MTQQKPEQRPRTEHRRDGVLYAVAGFSRSGKSTWVDQKTRNERRLLVWDYPKGEWHTKFKCRRVSSLDELARCALPDSKPERIAYLHVSERPDIDFQNWARLAWIFIRAHGAPVIAEELSSVTHPGKAQAAWGNVCRMGLGYGSDIYAITQRPAESDKTSLGNSSVIHCGLMGTLNDRKIMSQYLDVPLAEVEALRQFEWIERDRRDFKLTRGKVKKSRK